MKHRYNNHLLKDQCHLNKMIAVLLKNIFAVFVLNFTAAKIPFTSLQSIMNLFESEKLHYLWHDIIFLTDLSSSGVQASFAAHFQVAAASHKMDSSKGVNFFSNIYDSDRSNSILILYMPTSVQDLYEIINRISICSSRNASWIRAYQRISFLLWPAIQEPWEIKSELRSNLDLLEIVEQIPLIEHVYILAWSLDPTGAVNLLDMIEVYGIVGHAAVIESIGNVVIANYGNTFLINTTDLFNIATRRNDFHGIVFKTVAENDAYYEAEVSVKMFDNGTVYFPSGSSFSILLDLMKMLNFRHEPILGNGWTEPEQNGTEITGMGLQVFENEADICISTSSMEFYLSKFITFLQPVMSEESFVFFRQPSITAARTIFMMPFVPTLWYFIFFIWALIMICAGFIAMRKPDLAGHIGTSSMYLRFRTKQEQFNWYDAYLWTIGIACQQGWFGSPVQVSVRILFVTGLFTNLVLFSYYTAAFVAAISAPIIPVQTFSDLSKHAYVIFANPSNPGFISSFALPQQQSEILEVSSKVFKSDDDAVAKIMTQNSKYATIIGLDGFYSVGLGAYSDRELCQIDRLKGGDAARIKDAMFVRKGSSYKEMLGHGTIRLVETGLANRYLLSYKANTELSCLKNTAQTFELNFLDCYTAFLILFFAHVLAFSIAFLERHKRRSTYFF